MMQVENGVSSQTTRDEPQCRRERRLCQAIPERIDELSHDGHADRRELLKSAYKRQQNFGRVEDLVQADLPGLNCAGPDLTDEKKMFLAAVELGMINFHGLALFRSI